MQDRSKQIATLNDIFRFKGKGFVMTPGVLALPHPEEVHYNVRTFHDFNEDNDPYGEHDFGSFPFGDHKLFWKIDYYDETMQFGCDALDPQCRRVLTVMLANEY